jgi:short-subunit dehydrogenase
MQNATHWIIGASSGIGKAVAQAALKRGEPVIISARDATALQHIAAPYPTLCTVLPLDITDAAAVAAAIQTLPTPLASVHVYVGTYNPALVIEGTPANLTQTVLTNFTAVVALVQMLLPQLRQQTAGTKGSIKSRPAGPVLALCGSVAGYVGLPKGQPYSATKAALINFTQSLRAEELAHARRHQHPAIDVRLISPGFVRTKLTAKNDFTMPFLIEPAAAAHSIWRQLRCPGRFNIAFPWPMAAIMALLRALPYRLYFTLLGR